MIATLTGRVAEKIGETVILDVQGVGYALLMTLEDYGALSPGHDAKVYVYEHIRENTHDLFGFTSLDTKQFFEQLLGVNGVGPKMALSVLNIGTASDVRRAIAAGDTKFIQGATGVGRRVAERIVVELKDKVGLDGVGLASSGLLQGESAMQHDEAAQALISLGYSMQDAVRALQSIDTSLSTEERIKQALKAA